MKDDGLRWGGTLSAVMPDAVETAISIGQRQERMAFDCCGDWLREVALELGADVRESAAVPGDGYVTRNRDETYSIWLSSLDDLPIGRRNFTLAHEIGHIILDRLYPHVERYTTRVPSQKEAVERAADKLAVELLMPEDVVLAQLIRHQWAIEGQYSPFALLPRVFRDTRRSLGVSESAMLRRLVELPQIASLQMAITFSRDHFWDSEAPFPCKIRRFVKSHCHVEGPWRSVICDLWLHDMNSDDNYTILARTDGRFLEIPCGGWERNVNGRNKITRQLVVLGWHFLLHVKGGQKA